MYLGAMVNVYAADGSGRVVGRIEAPEGVMAIHEGGGAYADAEGVWHDAAPGGAGPGGGAPPGAAVETGENGEWMDASGQWYTAAGVPFDARARREAGGGEGGGVPCDDDSPCGGGSCDRCADGSAVCGGRAFDWCRPAGFRSGGGGGMTSFTAGSRTVAGIPSIYLVYGAVAVGLYLLLRRS